jgi:hypothetical protein
VPVGSLYDFKKWKSARAIIIILDLDPGVHVITDRTRFGTITRTYAAYLPVS